MEDLKEILKLTNVDEEDFKDNYGVLHKVISCLGLLIENDRECELCKYNIPCGTVTTCFNNNKDSNLIIKVLQRYYKGNKKTEGIVNEVRSIIDDTGVEIDIKEIIPEDLKVKEVIPEEIIVEKKKKLFIVKDLADSIVKGLGEQVPEKKEIKPPLGKTRNELDFSLVNQVLAKILRGDLEFKIEVVVNNSDLETTVIRRCEEVKDDNIVEEIKEDCKVLKNNEKFNKDLDIKVDEYIGTRKRGFKKSQILKFLTKFGYFISELELEKLLSAKTSIYFDIARGIYKLIKRIKD